MGLKEVFSQRQNLSFQSVVRCLADTNPLDNWLLDEEDALDLCPEDDDWPDLFSNHPAWVSMWDEVSARVLEALLAKRRVGVSRICGPSPDGPHDVVIETVAATSGLSFRHLFVMPVDSFKYSAGEAAKASRPAQDLYKRYQQLPSQVRLALQHRVAEELAIQQNELAKNADNSDEAFEDS